MNNHTDLTALSSNEIVSVVDTKDNVIHGISRKELRLFGGIYRVTYVLVFNRKGEILVQKRTNSKDQYPGLFDLAAGGVVMAHEDYASSARRELMEELGISAVLEAHGMVYFEDMDCVPANQNWGAVFSCVHEGPFELQEEEVSSASFIEISAVLTWKKTLITPDTRQVLVAYLL